MKIDVPEVGCVCGREHPRAHGEMIIGSGVLDQLGSIVDGLKLGDRCLILADNNTFAKAGEQTVGQLERGGRFVITLVLERDGELVGDEYSLGEALLGLESAPAFLVALGSGTITDITRYLAKIHKVPFIVVATAPSMDGYVSGVAPLITHGRKQTFLAQPPEAFIADLSILADSPARMVQAGIGDLIGKVTSKADWLLGHYLHDEYYCPSCQKLVDDAVTMTIENLDGAMATEPEQRETFLTALTHGLILSGVAMALVGTSRPASGSEHHLSHYWEMKGLEENVPLPLHGQKVGYSTYLILKVYEKAMQRAASEQDEQLQSIFAKISPNLLSSEEYMTMLTKVDALRSYTDLGIPRDWVDSALREAMHVRERYTILRLADEKGWLEGIADEIMSELER